MVRKDRDPLHELLYQDAALGVLCGTPDGPYIKIRKHLGNSFESPFEVALRLSVGSPLCRLRPSKLNVYEESVLFFLEPICTDLPRVMKLQQSPAIFREFPQVHRRRCRAVPATPAGVPAGPARHPPTNGLLELWVGAEQ